MVVFDTDKNSSLSKSEYDLMAEKFCDYYDLKYDTEKDNMDRLFDLADSMGTGAGVDDGGLSISQMKMWAEMAHATYLT